MKRYFNIKLLLMLVLVGSVSLLSSCLKNNKYYVDFGDYKPSVELPLAAKNANKPFPMALNVTGEPVDYFVYVNVASMDKPSSPVKVQLAIDSEYLSEYNSAQDAATKKSQADYLAADPDHTENDNDYPADYVPYILFPDSLYTIDKMELTVPAGERQAFATLKVKTWQMDFTAKYCLPFTIASADPNSYNISSWKHLMINISAKNMYDGAYDVTGTFVDKTNPAYKGYYPQSINLITQGPKSVAYFDKILGDYGYIFDTGAGLSYFGNFGVVFVFDDNNNVVDVHNIYSDPAPRSRQAKLNPSGVNKYDPETKTLQVSYYMMQAGAVRLEITETFKYKGAR